MSTGMFLAVWLFGVLAGYCFGRAHAAWKQIDSMIDNIDATIVKLEKGRK
jgi:hypothetical protein